MYEVSGKIVVNGSIEYWEISFKSRNEARAYARWARGESNRFGTKIQFILERI